MTTSSSSSKPNLNLALATLSFAICFAAWGLISAFVPHFREVLHLDATQTGLLVAVPVLLGSLARIPMGILADRFGGRAVFTLLMLVVAVPTALVATARSYHALLLDALFLGLAGSSFAIGVGFVSRRYPPEGQGTAVGIYGIGNIGQSAVVFGAPFLLRSQFGLGLVDAGFRTAGFVALATAMRPLGGWLSDKIRGARLLSAVFLGIVPFALLLIWPAILPFTVGALGCATLQGLGNGAVFKLVPQYFPRETGTVSGLVGALGGLGGFFPPLLLGFFRDHTGASSTKAGQVAPDFPFFLKKNEPGGGMTVAE